MAIKLITNFPKIVGEEFYNIAALLCIAIFKPNCPLLASATFQPKLTELSICWNFLHLCQQAVATPNFPI